MIKSLGEEFSSRQPAPPPKTIAAAESEQLLSCSPATDSTATLSMGRRTLTGRLEEDNETASYHSNDDEINPGRSDIEMKEAYEDTTASDRDNLLGYIKKYDSQASIATDVPRCFVNIRNPKVGTCQHEFGIPVELRYRKAVSDFFGRNKTATASIPMDCYPVICRTCYQNTHYRLTNMDSKDPAKCDAADADIKCDIIIYTLEKMKGRTFEDRNGDVWPWWCGLELQTTNEGHQLLTDTENLKKKAEEKNKLVHEHRERAKNQGTTKGNPRLHYHFLPDQLPTWLLPLCQKQNYKAGNDQKQYALIGDRQGQRYSFDEVTFIVKSIKTYCVEELRKFPSIEAIPVPIGMLDMEIYQQKCRARKAANSIMIKLNAEARQLEREADKAYGGTYRKGKAKTARQLAQQSTQLANIAAKDADDARADAKLSAPTIPAKRRKVANKMKNEDVAYAEGNDSDMEKWDDQTVAMLSDHSDDDEELTGTDPDTEDYNNEEDHDDEDETDLDEELRETDAEPNTPKNKRQRSSARSTTPSLRTRNTLSTLKKRLFKKTPTMPAITAHEVPINTKRELTTTPTITVTEGCPITPASGGPPSKRQRRMTVTPSTGSTTGSVKRSRLTTLAGGIDD